MEAAALSEASADDGCATFVVVVESEEFESDVGGTAPSLLEVLLLALSALEVGSFGSPGALEEE